MIVINIDNIRERYYSTSPRALLSKRYRIHLEAYNLTALVEVCPGLLPPPLLHPVQYPSRLILKVNLKSFSLFRKILMDSIFCRSYKNFIISRARILMTCHLSFLARQTIQFNILILDMERRLQKQLFIVHFPSFCVVFKFYIVFVILMSFFCHIFKVHFIFK